MDFTQSMDNGYMIPSSIAVGSGEATDIRCVCDTVEDFRTFLDSTGMELRYEGLITYEKVNKLLKVYEGNNAWKTVGEGGGSVDTSNFITLTQLSQQLNNYYTKAEVNEKMGNKNFKYLTQVEYEALPSVEKNDSNVVYGIIDMEDIFSLNLEGNTLSLLKNGKAISSVVIQSVQDDGEVDNNPILVSSISLDKTTHVMEVGETFQLNYTINPSNATNKEVVWETSNDKCTVLNGLVSAISVGECVVTVKTVEGSKMASCTITISEGQNIGPSTGATLVHSYDFTVDNNDKTNSFNLDSSRKATRNTGFMVERFESFSIKAFGTFTSQYLNEIFSGYPKEGKNITNLYSPAIGRFQIYRDISYGAAKGDVSIKYYNSEMQEITVKTTGQIPKDSTSTIILTYNKQDSETNIYIDGVNVYCGNIDLNIDGLIADNSLKTLEVYDGIISMEA